MTFPSTAPAARRAAAPCLAALVLAGSALAGGTTYTSVQAGSWTNPAVWDLGSPPELATGAQAFVLHEVTVDTPDAESNSVSVEPLEYMEGLEIVAGGTLQTNSLYVGGLPFGGYVKQTGGNVFADEVDIGRTDAFGSYTMEGGSLSSSVVNVGVWLGNPGPSGVGVLVMRGAAPSITATSLFAIRDQSFMRIEPSANGGAGLTPIATHDLLLEDVTHVQVFPSYQAEVGDRWDLFTYSGTFTGTLELHVDSPYSMAVDTSVPGVVSVEVTASPHPIPGETCATAIALDPGGEINIPVNLGSMVADPGPPPCYFDLDVPVGSDIWFSLTNDSALPRGYLLQLGWFGSVEPLTGLEQFAACGGVALACAGLGSEVPPMPGVEVYPPLVMTIPAGETHFVRLASAELASHLQFDLDVERVGAFVELGPGLAGAGGVPDLDVSGWLTSGTPTTIAVSAAVPDAVAAVFFGFGLGTPAPFKGGTLYPLANTLIYFDTTSPTGELTLGFPWPAGLPADFVLELQAAVVDAGAPFGVALTRGVRAVAP